MQAVCLFGVVTFFVLTNAMHNAKAMEKQQCVCKQEGREQKDSADSLWETSSWAYGSHLERFSRLEFVTGSAAVLNGCSESHSARVFVGQRYLYATPDVRMLAEASVNELFSISERPGKPCLKR